VPKRNIVWIALIAIGAVVVVWATTRLERPDAPAPEPALPAVDEAYRLIARKYYDREHLDKDRASREAIRGMVAGALDEYSSYIAPDELDQFLQHMAGRNRGIGLVIEPSDGKIQIVGPLPGSPAHRAGLYGGQLLAVDGRSTAGQTVRAVERLLAGEPGSSVTLAVADAGGGPREVTLSRSEFHLESVTGLFRDGGGRWVFVPPGHTRVGYIRIREFVSDTPSALQEVLRSLVDVEACVLDLRGNPGGTLPDAVAVADMFLPGGVIVTVAAHEGPSQVYRAHEPGTSDLTLVVLVDAETASAAEIVAGALARHDRAMLVGQRSLGKGCVQTMCRLGDTMGQINLTTAEFLVGGDTAMTRLPGRRTWGVGPHMEVTLARHKIPALEHLRRYASVVARPQATTAPGAVPPQSVGRDILALDTQLSRAVALARTPTRVRVFLAGAAAERARSATQPASRPDTVPAKDR